MRPPTATGDDAGAGFVQPTAGRWDDGFAVPYLRPGQLISLVRWSCSREGWSYTTVLVQYVSRDDHTWHVVVCDEPASLSREEWAIFS